MQERKRGGEVPREKREIRSTSIDNWKVEAITAEGGNDDELIIEGYAAVFNVLTKIESYNGEVFLEKISPKAFNNTNFKNVPLKYNHSNDYPLLASTRNGSLVLEADDKGLKIKANLLNTQEARDMVARVKAGLISTMSFAFTVADARKTVGADNITIREITNIDQVYDVSLVDMAAYEQTSVSARSYEHIKKESMRILVARWSNE